jgi:hypothetical protein
MRKKARLTHGEAYVLKKETINFKNELKVINVTLESLPKRMERDEALKYYTTKFKNYWGEQMTQTRRYCHV